MNGGIEDPFGLRPLWDALLEVYRAYADICRKHGLRHYVAFGTLLGAVRHRGFIPWDDDFDVLMPRPDYERFVEFAARELPQHFRFVNWHNTPEFKLLFGKIQDSRRGKVESIERRIGHQLSNGIFIDVFPIDGYPTSCVGKVAEKFLGVLRMSYFRFLTRRSRPPAKTLLGKVSTMVGGIVSPLYLFKGTSSLMKSAEEVVLSRCFSPFRVSAVTGNRVGSYESVYPSGVFEDVKMVPFDSVMVPIPVGVETLLRLSYGDYMQLPPVECRRPSHEYGDRCPWWLGPTV